MRFAVNVVATLGMSVTLSAAATSFDCVKAVTKAENAVCASPILSKLDDDLAEQYQHALNRTPDAGGARSEIRAAQRTWLHETRDACSDNACLETVYSQRVGALKAARALYEEAAGTAKLEDQNPPPANATAETAASAPAPVAALASIGTASEAPSNPGTPMDAASASAAQPVQTATPSELTNASEASMNSFNSGHAAILVGLAAWLGAITGIAIWLRRRGQSRLVAWGGGFLAATFALAVVGWMTMPHRNAPVGLAKQAEDAQSLPAVAPIAVAPLQVSIDSLFDTTIPQRERERLARSFVVGKFHAMISYGVKNYTFNEDGTWSSSTCVPYGEVSERKFGHGESGSWTVQEGRYRDTGKIYYGVMIENLAQLKIERTGGLVVDNGVGEPRSPTVRGHTTFCGK